MDNVRVSRMRMRAILAISLVFSTFSPAVAAPNYIFPIVGCSYTYSRYHHDYPATDILAKKGCKYVAVTNGVVDEIRKVDTYNYKKPTPLTKGGIYVSIIGDDGVRYYGSHLSKVEVGIAPGVQVTAGQKLGEVGSTGSARGTAPHLHFGISYPTAPGDWKIRRGVLYPWKYLDAWKTGKDLSPSKAIAAAKEKAGK